MTDRDINDNKLHTKVRFNLSPDWHGALTEDLYVEILDDKLQKGKVKSIPFFVKEISLDDIIEYKLTDGLNVFSKIVEKSKFSIYIIFFKETEKDFVRSIMSQLEMSKIELEKSERFFGLCSVCIKNGEELEKFDNIIGKFIDSKIDIQTNSYRF